MRISDWSSDVCSSDLTIDFGGMVAHRLNRRDGLVKRLAKALRFFDLHRVNFGRVHDAGQLAQLARCVVFLTGKLLCDLVEAVDDPPFDARRNGGKEGVDRESVGTGKRG